MATEISKPPLDPDDLQAVDGGGQADYFGFSATDRYTFPDGMTYIELKVMNEGSKAKFQKKTQRDVVVERSSGNARFNVDAAKDRHELIRECATGWNLSRGGQLVPFNERNLSDFLNNANPKFVEEIEEKIRKMNPWLQGVVSKEDLEKEIANLQSQLEELEASEAGK